MNEPTILLLETLNGTRPLVELVSSFANDFHGLVDAIVEYCCSNPLGFGVNFHEIDYEGIAEQLLADYEAGEKNLDIRELLML